MFVAVCCGVSRCSPMSLICHESVRNGDHFQRWAEKRLRGSVQEVSKSFELRHSDALGVHAVARSAISAGDLIIAEDALLRILPLKDAARRLLERFGDLEGFLQPALGVDWGSTDKEVREAALELFYAHPITERRSQESAHITACEELLQMWPPLRATGWSPAQLLRFLHIVDLNIHKDERPSHAEFTGIFVLGSKFSHSCEPNASWSFDQRGRLQYGAIRPIAAGEVLTFSYVGNGMNLITSTLVRRQRLATLCFICRCERCKGPDLARPLPCPRCRGECLPCYPDQDESGFGIHGSRCDAIEDAVLWRCTGCEAQVPASELPLQAEAELAELVPQVMQAPPDSASEDYGNRGL
ncbi:unnamed protein product [Effrenium voratum]|nr:unnamed protein product [Effrenium voratum]